MCKPPKNQIENEKIQNEKLSEEYYKPEHLWVGRKAIKKLFQNTGISKKQNQISVSATNVIASSHSTSKRYRTSTLSSHNSKSIPSI